MTSIAHLALGLLLLGAVSPAHAVAQANLQALRAQAKAGSQVAQFELAGVYARGELGLAQNLETAAVWFQKSASQGHVEAQLTIGVYYLLGQGVPQDHAEAIRWFRLAGDQDNVFALNNLGVIYQGVPEPFRAAQPVGLNHAESVRFFRRAAELGHAPSAVYLGVKYRDGDGVDRDPAEAFRWYLHAAELGDVTALGEVGAMYAAGNGVEQDDVEAYRWLELATLHMAGGDREVLLLDREMVAERLTADQIAEAERRAQGWEPNRSGR